MTLLSKEIPNTLMYLTAIMLHFEEAGYLGHYITAILNKEQLRRNVWQEKIWISI